MLSGPAPPGCDWSGSVGRPSIRPPRSTRPATAPPSVVAAAAAPSRSSAAHPGVQPGPAEVYQQADDDDDDGEVDDRPFQHRYVVLGRGDHRTGAESGQAEDVLYQDGRTQQA